MRLLLIVWLGMYASTTRLAVADVLGSYRSEPHDDYSHTSLTLKQDLGKKQQLTFTLDSYQGGDCGGTSHVLRGTWQVASDSTLQLRPEKEDEYLNDATVKPQEWHRKYTGKPITVSLLRDGNRVIALRLGDRRYLQRVQGQ